MGLYGYVIDDIIYISNADANADANANANADANCWCRLLFPGLSRYQQMESETWNDLFAIRIRIRIRIGLRIRISSPVLILNSAVLINSSMKI